MEDLTPDKIKLYREAFEMFDRDKDGSINTKELSEVMRHLFINENTLFSEETNEKNIHHTTGNTNTNTNNMSDSFYKGIISEADIDGNEKIDFEEFVILMYRRSKQSNKIKEELQNAFKVFDKNGDNKISNEELLNLLTFLNNKLSEDQINEILEENDLDKDGYLNYMEFIEYVLNNKIN